MQRIGKQTTIHLSDEDLEQLQKIADFHGIKRAEVHRELLRLGMATWDDLHRIGVPQFTEFVKKVKKSVREGVQPKLV